MSHTIYASGHIKKTLLSHLAEIEVDTLEPFVLKAPHSQVEFLTAELGLYLDYRDISCMDFNEVVHELNQLGPSITTDFYRHQILELASKDKIRHDQISKGFEIIGTPLSVFDFEQSVDHIFTLIENTDADKFTQLLKQEPYLKLKEVRPILALILESLIDVVVNDDEYEYEAIERIIVDSLENK